MPIRACRNAFCRRLRLGRRRALRTRMIGAVGPRQTRCFLKMKIHRMDRLPTNRWVQSRSRRASLMPPNALKQALAPYCLGGPYDRLLDADAERLGDADVVVFETEGLIGSGAASPVLSYLFHRIEGRLDGRPTLLVIDEGWLVLDDGDFAGQLREWLKTLRKKNASVVFATQSLADTVDELDAFVMTALEELSLLEPTIDGPQAETKLAALWKKTFTVAAAVQEAWLEQAVIRRGRAIVEDIYPDADERRRLYQYGFSPFVGRRFEAVAPAIADQLAAAIDYGAETAVQRLARFEALGELLKEDRGFGFRVRETVGDREILEAWTDVLSWWMRAPSGEVPEASNLRARQRFVADNLEFRLGVAIGAVVAQKWTAGAGDPLAVPSLVEWKATTGLPWFGFWARELLRWGTLDPFVAFALAQGRAKTREDAEALRSVFDRWLGEKLDAPTSEDLIDPQQFLAWERSLPARKRERVEALPEEAELTGTSGAMKRYNVLPIAGKDEVIWLDASGYELARSSDELGLQNRSLTNDYVLNAEGQATVSRVFVRSRRA
ncbi:Conjugal transfer protein trbE [Gluconacetobacter sp. SXCC-1]|nr:Conjugal transfer protein trbE [Gluconacetobacter sp. SXCC-1]